MHGITEEEATAMDKGQRLPTETVLFERWFHLIYGGGYYIRLVFYYSIKIKGGDRRKMCSSS